MSEQSQQSDADGVASNATPADSFSSNGSYPEGAVGVAEPAETPETPESVAADAAPALEASAEATDAVAVEPAADASLEAATEPAPDDGTAFLAELARAMQATAGVERTRLEEDTDRRREAHLASIRARRESEATSMRELAAEDLKSIDEWAETERQRIDKEREQRAAALQEDLETSLAEHGSKIDREIEAVDAAIVAYRADVDAYFAALDNETDPVEIARHAGRRPSFPDLEAVSAAESETPATNAEGAAVGVMDQVASGDVAAAWAQWNETTAPADPNLPPEQATSSLLQSVPVYRPYAKLSGETHDK